LRRTAGGFNGFKVANPMKRRSVVSDCHELPFSPTTRTDLGAQHRKITRSELTCPT
jgi:hypothetical protein